MYSYGTHIQCISVGPGKLYSSPLPHSFTRCSTPEDMIFSQTAAILKMAFFSISLLGINQFRQNLVHRCKLWFWGWSGDKNL